MKNTFYENYFFTILFFKREMIFLANSFISPDEKNRMFLPSSAISSTPTNFLATRKVWPRPLFFFMSGAEQPYRLRSCPPEKSENEKFFGRTTKVTLPYTCYAPPRVLRSSPGATLLLRSYFFCHSAALRLDHPNNPLGQGYRYHSANVSKN